MEKVSKKEGNELKNSKRSETRVGDVEREECIRASHRTPRQLHASTYATNREQTKKS